MTAFKKILAFVPVFLLTAGVFFTSCGTEDGTYVAPITLGEKIHGSWVLNSLVQVDEVNSTELDLSGYFDFMTFALELNADAENNPTTFSVTGNAPAIIPTSGSWAMENDFNNSDGTPARIFLLGEDGTKEAALTVTSIPGATRSLSFRYTRLQNGSAFVSYVYNLVPATAAE